MCICVKYGTWAIAREYQPGQAAALERAGFSPITAAVLCSRGYDTPESAHEFLTADAPLTDPFELLDMEAARARVQRALDWEEMICVFGDYDVDGITATCLLTEFLRERGGNVVSYIPARLEEGYGLNPTAVQSLKRRGVKLIITVDCGITALDEAELCRKNGMDLVVTDHHECRLELPQCAAVVDPHRADQPAGAQRMLAGVGVAFKLAAAIAGDQQALLEKYSDLLCLGTVADVMPLLGENRTMVSRGLEALAHPKRVGLTALMAECGAKPPVTAGLIGYTLAPRINAAGRMGQVQVALELFLTRSAARAQELAQFLCRLNRRRQEVESEIYEQASAMLPKDRQPDAIVLASEHWHQGVVGIVASRLAEEYRCPTFLICLDGNKGKASSRSYGGFNLFEALTELSGLLESYGGHELAAGFTIRRANIDAFREAVCARAAAFARADTTGAALQVDCCIPPALLTLENVAALDELEPCGAGCPRPVLCMTDLTVTELSEVGGGKHLRLRLTRGRRSFRAIYFSSTAVRAGVAVGDTVDVAFTPQVNDYRALRTVQLSLIDIRPSETDRESLREGEGLYQKFLHAEPLLPEEAAALLPERHDFVAVWRYLAANAQDGSLLDELGCLSRKITRQTGSLCTCGRLRICLDVFCEQKLLSLRAQRGAVQIALCTDGRKADLESSSILARLKKAKDR